MEQSGYIGGKKITIYRQTFTLLEQANDDRAVWYTTDSIRFKCVEVY